ncbi:MAG: DUF1800 domain-containing protein [Bacteroidia bacterium]|nr:DUF1800 domain-containing protein [Bacteroidia bacterium]
MACELDSINVFVPTANKPWNQQRAQHLYRRMAFGAEYTNIQQAISTNPATLIDNLVDAAGAMLPTPAPVWANWALSDYTDVNTQGPAQILEWYTQFMKDMLENGFRDKLTLFWSNHFVTQLSVYNCPSYMFQYYNLIQRHALGNFKDFVHAIGISPAMIVFLNSYQNTAVSPNENYARELYELFTLGADNDYTQTDIVETAKALTGWNGFTDFCAPLTFVDANHSHASKTIFGQTGDWGYDDVVDILFSQRGTQVAKFICTKLYKFFVSPQPNDTIINALAATFVSNNFELAPVYKQLFKSEHFFDDDIVGVNIKSPIDLMLTFIKEGSFSYDQQILSGSQYYGALLGQEIFEPVDVAGWQGNHFWVNTSTLTGRWLICEYFAGWLYQNHPEELKDLALEIVGPTSDPALVTRKVVDFFLSRGFQSPEEYAQATTVFKWEVPQNYYDNGMWNLNQFTVPAQMYYLLLHIFRTPEFQLN